LKPLLHFAPRNKTHLAFVFGLDQGCLSLFDRPFQRIRSVDHLLNVCPKVVSMKLEASFQLVEEGIQLSLGKALILQDRELELAPYLAFGSLGEGRMVIFKSHWFV